MKKIKRTKKSISVAHISMRAASLCSAILLVLGLAIPTIIPRQGQAVELLQNRSLTLASSAAGDISTTGAGANLAVPAGEGGNGAKTKHTIKFRLFETTGPTVGSIAIVYCDNPILQSTCTTPAGMDAANVTSATLAITVNGSAPGTAYTLDTTTPNPSWTNYGVCNGSGATRTNCILLTRTATAEASGTIDYVISYGGTATSYIKNPISPTAGTTTVTSTSYGDNYPFYARVLVFTDAAYTLGNILDAGSTAATVNQQIDISPKVREILNFSVGAGTGSVPGTSGTPPAAGGTCAPIADAGAIYLGDGDNVLSTSQAYDTHSFFRINTNTVNGTIVYYTGDTLKSGSQSITAMGTGGPPPTTAVASSPGSKQFGLALDTGSSNHSFTSLSATSPYGGGSGTITSGGTALFAFYGGSTTDPRPIASSSGGINCDTGDVRYIANISTSTAAGIYRTTITYIAVGTY